jgi:lipoprotein NlpD
LPLATYQIKRGSNELKVCRIAGLLSGLLLAACASQPTRAPAPIVERTKPTGAPVAKPAAPVQTGASAARPIVTPVSDADARGKFYTVKPGDTLYSIALENGLDYRDIAGWNHVADVNLIKVDQILRLSDPAEDAQAAGDSGVVVRPLKPSGSDATPTSKVETAAGATLSFPKAIKVSPGTDAATIARQAEGTASPVPAGKPVEAKPAEAKPATDSKPAAAVASAGGDEEVSWAWPTIGKVITPYSDAGKGIDIAGKLGQPVLAAGAGKVVYAGSGLRGYGKLVIIKHNKMYLSAYAHNSQLLVKEGDSVKKGDKIAEMGSSDAEQVKLHFEVRRFGKPVDPTKFLTAG